MLAKPGKHAKENKDLIKQQWSVFGEVRQRELIKEILTQSTERDQRQTLVEMYHMQSL